MDDLVSQKTLEYCGGYSLPDVMDSLRRIFNANDFDRTEVMRVIMWKARGSWLQSAGPGPGQPGCQVDRRLLEYFQAPPVAAPKHKRYSAMSPAEKASVDASFAEIKRNFAVMAERTEELKGNPLAAAAKPLPPEIGADSAAEDRRYGGKVPAGEPLGGTSVLGDQESSNANQRASEAA